MVKALVLGTEAALLGKPIFFSRTRWDLNVAYEGPPGGCLGAGRSFQLPGGDFQESSLHGETAATGLVTQKQKCFQKRSSVCILL